MEITIENLKKTFNNHLILDIDRVFFPRSGAYCIRGRNGTGKTTLLQIIASLQNADSGHVSYNGNHISPEIMKKMTYVSPNPYIFDMTVEDNIYYPLKVRGIEKKVMKRELDDFIDYYELSEIRNQNAKKCSSGEKMKTALVRAFIIKPEVLLLDEPTTNLDVESIEKLKRSLIELKADSTIIFISHDRDFIKSVSDKEYLIIHTHLEG